MLLIIITEEKIHEKLKLLKFQFPKRKENYRKCLFTILQISENLKNEF